MRGGSRFTEDPATLAAEAYALADQLCGSCRNFHALWPYRRFTRMVGAVEAGAPELHAALRQLFEAGRRRVLIAGAADTGVPALVARAGADHGLDCMVIDRCETPLELCRRFAQRWSLSIETVRQDLVSLDIENRFDIVVAHSLLQFIPAEGRVDFLSRVMRALRPEGRLLLVFNTGARIEGEVQPDYRRSYGEWVVEEMRRMNLPLPTSRDVFQLRLDEYARELESREGAFGDPRDVDAMMEAGGLTIVQRAEIDMPLAKPFQHFVSKLTKRRHLAIAAPKPRA